MTSTAEDDSRHDVDLKSGSASYEKKRPLSISPPNEANNKQPKITPSEELKVTLQSVSYYAQDRPPAAFQLPVQITSFSYDESRNLHHDDRSIRYYHSPPPRADLNRGFQDLISRDESVNEHLDSLLLSLMKMVENGKDEHQIFQKANLITWRGMMTKLCTILYEDRQDWDMNAMMIGDTLYLEEHVGSVQRADKAKQQEDTRLKMFGYYGYSFESWTCSEKANPIDPWDGNVNTNVQWCSIVKTRLGDTRCILAGEVDAVDPRTKAPIEVKTSMNIRNARDEERFESKMLRFYMQSFLLGIAMVVVGFRDHRGYLVTHQEFQTLSMPRAVRGKPHEWDPTACLNFASQLLTSIRSNIRKGLPEALPTLEVAEKDEGYPVHRIHFDYHTKQVTVSHLSPADIQTQVKGGSSQNRVGFLLSSYYELVRKSLM